MTGNPFIRVNFRFHGNDGMKVRECSRLLEFLKVNAMSRKELILLAVVSGAVGGAVSAIVAMTTLGLLEWLLPAVPSAYTMTFILYSVLMTLVVIVFVIALVYAFWRALRSGWSLKNKEHRREARENIREKVRQWPTGKRDALTAMALTWTAATYTFLLALILTMPRGRFTEQELSGTTLAILILAVTPILLLVYWHIYEFARGVWLDWRTETRKGRIRIATIAIASIFIFALFIWGDVSGWKDRVWFAG